jgi:hypothetical protein
VDVPPPEIFGFTFFHKFVKWMYIILAPNLEVEKTVKYKTVGITFRCIVLFTANSVLLKHISVYGGDVRP